ncbi:GPP34 family phosphoprotein [Streptomyces sp. NPDC096538]|uniref:GPP34 family phosphoprotein n=1 Tax=Streptomyces sp. NPDC096538 TaxID=3155427 RepID=UPI00332CC2FC
MTTAHDLAALAAAPGTDPAPDRGDLSLVLAGAELLDLADARAVVLGAERITPVVAPHDVDPMLMEAASEITREPPYETVESWLWRRGAGLAARYGAAVEAAEPYRPPRSHRRPFHRPRPVVSPLVVRHGVDRLRAGDPLFVGLAAAAGMAEAPADVFGSLADDETAVLAAIHQAITQLAAERQRRSAQQGAFDNIWQTP